jgi:hypothetical protein
MSLIKSIDWTWNQGKVFTIIEYYCGKKDIRENLEPPPTKACHDIAHFICAMNGNLEWDYAIAPNHIAEYNAVFVENLLSSFSHCYYNNLIIDIKTHSNIIFNEMKWFAKNYYKIHRDHPSEKRYCELKEDFLSVIDLDILVQYFVPYYQTYVIGTLVGTSEFDISVKLDSSIEYKFEPLYNYLTKIKTNLLERKK